MNSDQRGRADIGGAPAGTRVNRRIDHGMPKCITASEPPARSQQFARSAQQISRDALAKDLDDCRAMPTLGVFLREARRFGLSARRVQTYRRQIA